MTRKRATSAWLALLLPLDGLTAIAPGTAVAQSRSLTGVIRGYECGDNCYLTIVDASRKEHTGLCSARACKAWNEAAAMPACHKGQRVTVTLGQGTQTDASGNIMGRTTAFQSITFLD